MPKKTIKTSVTVGIPAYNEEANIGHLLESLFKQKGEFTLKRVIVVSDGSDDKTAAIIKHLRQEKIILLEHKKRQGVAVAQNQIFALADTEILVLLHADILIKDANFIARLIKPIQLSQADLTAASLKALPARNLFEKVLSVGLPLKNRLFEKFQAGDNLYHCHGPARAFSQKLYRSLRFPQSVGEDAYSYLYCLSWGGRFAYVKKAAAYYRLPGSLADHRRQSLRFYTSSRLMAELFNKRLVAASYQTSRKELFSALFYCLTKSPFYTLIYLCLTAFLKVDSFFESRPQNTWEVAQSSKVLLKEGR